jgi:hypothetical protein
MSYDPEAILARNRAAQAKSRNAFQHAARARARMEQLVTSSEMCIGSVARLERRISDFRRTKS